MLRTLKIKLKLDDSSKKTLHNIQQEYSNCCNEIVKYVIKHREFNQIRLHHLAYYDIKKTSPLNSEYKVMGVDVGENNIAATSSGTIYGGNKLKHQRDKYLGLCKRLQSNGSQSAKQKLRKISGKEARHVKSINHKISKQVVKCAKHSGMKSNSYGKLNYY